MAYALGFSKDVTALIYSMRDKNNWNADKNRSTPLGRLFTWPHLRPQYILEPDSWPQCILGRDPEPPCFVGRGQEKGVHAEVYERSWVSPFDNTSVYKVDPEYSSCYDEVAVLRLETCWGDLTKPFDFFTCEPCLPNNETPGGETARSGPESVGAWTRVGRLQWVHLSSDENSRA